MTRKLAGCVTWFVLFLGSAHAVPARLPYQPSEPPRPIVPSMAGTTWIGMLFVDGSKVTFYADGTLAYGETGHTSPGVWRLTGSELSFEINKYSEYKTVLKGDIIEGVGWNKDCQKCTPRLKRMENPPR